MLSIGKDHRINDFWFLCHISQAFFTTWVFGSLLSGLGWYLLFQGLLGWNFIIHSHAGGHHNPKIYHDGGKFSIDKPIDFGEFTLMSTTDTKGFKYAWWAGFYWFGDHQLHHLFPTIDAAYYPHLYDEFDKTVKEFGLGKFVQPMSKPRFYLEIVDQLQKSD